MSARLSQWLNGDDRTLIVRSQDLTGPLRELAEWAEKNRLGLAGLEVGPPSLEDAYLAVIGEPVTARAGDHA